MTADSGPPPADVRLRGFSTRTSVANALAWLDSTLPPLAALAREDVDLLEAAGRVLADDVVSPVNVPAFPRSMMDGYAVRAEETQGASAYNQLAFRVVGRSLPGMPCEREVGPGEAVLIMTGAPLPAGADAVVPVELTERAGDTVHVLEAVASGKHVGQVGEDLRAGTVVLPRGRVLRPQDVGLLSSMGVGSVPVFRRPRVNILVTGNELLPAGTPPAGYRIADANGPMLAALVHRDGGEAHLCGIIRDDPDAIAQALDLPAEVVLVSGGSSVGSEDHVPRLLAQRGILAIHGIAMRPSSPAGLGLWDGKLVCLLPGNPVSCLCAYDFFAGRAIRAWGGRPREWPYCRRAVVLTRKLVSLVGRLDYARVIIRGEEAEPLAVSGASLLSTTTQADGFVIVPEDLEGYPAGATVEAWLYR